MKKILLVILAIFITTAAQGGQLNLEVRTDYNSKTYENSAEADTTRFFFKTGRFDFQGQASENLSFRLRFAFTKDTTRVSPDSAQPAVDYAFVTHQMTESFALTAGKFNTDVGGFEGGSSSADLYLTSEAYSRTGPRGPLTASVMGTSDILYMTGVKGIFSLKNQEIHILATNETSSGAGATATQNSSLMGAIWRGNVLEKSLRLNLSYHTMKGPAVDDLYQFAAVGFLWRGDILVAQMDLLNYEFKDGAASKKDSLTSVVGKINYTGWEKWIPRFELTSSEEKIEISSSTKNKFLGLGAVLEYLPYSDAHFRYHIAYNRVEEQPEVGDNITRQEVFLGIHLIADFLK